MSSERMMVPSPVAAEMVYRNEFAMRQMIEDLRYVAQLTDENIDQLSNALLKIEGVPTTDQLVDLMAPFSDDPVAGASIITALQNLMPESQEQATATIEQTLETVNQWRQRNEQSREVFPDELFGALQKRLPRLLREYPAIFRYRKSNRLARRTGNIADGIEILCDIRPVFTKDRDEIVGLVPTTTMRISYEAQDGDDRVFEVNLPTAILKELRTRLESAERKLGVIERTGNNWIPHGIAEGV